MSPDELGIVVKLAAIGLRELERRDGVHDPALREVVYRLSLDARAARFGGGVDETCARGFQRTGVAAL